MARKTMTVMRMGTSIGEAFQENCVTITHL